MAGGDQSQDKTEEPTGKKLADARNKGNVASSREIPSVFVLAGGIGVIFFGGSWMLGRLIGLMRSIYQRAGTLAMSPENIHTFIWQVFSNIVVILVPIMLVVVTAGVVGNVAQFGFLLTGEKITPDLAKLNPISGIKRLFALRSLVELIKSILKLLIIGGVAYAVMQRYLDQIPGLMQLSIGGIVIFIGQAAFQISLYTCMVLFLMAILDFAYTKWQHQQDLKMSKQEVKDEHKQSEGDPSVKARIRSVQREMARRRMMEAVPGATVVITNPTHLAIAIKYEDGMHAPTVVAKGAGFVAQKIKTLAQESDVPLVENKPLARALFKSTEIGDFIPAEMYQVVAEILAYVYRLKGLVQG
ncbi:flagellar biosynthetic protein FlhB [Desulfosarcina ovata subsp. sediminis]|uniref:Flagellar biosynthetic protein FlhB n=1 Tax=Desulfosarcina ovata subsp. sediminis TaxID=885957 RepID=A0A5K7ZJB8_9BACT|nr:flagellar biosynthesis protein FlhB [Desulfosarcina ovata]BBO79809.1 flagellar biosynthetic protein FlhB [Desulfosarcina ovata subsp. sediminis]